MREFKPGDKVRILPHVTAEVEGKKYCGLSFPDRIGQIVTLKKLGGIDGLPLAWTIEEHRLYLLPDWFELVVKEAPTSITTDVNDLIDQVALGKIQRGGKQAQYTVYRDGDDVVIKLFGAAKK